MLTASAVGTLNMLQLALRALFVDGVPGDVAANFDTIRYMAEHIRDPTYTLDRFLDHVIEAFPELRLFYTSPDKVSSSGRTAEVEYQRTIGAMFAVYWLLRLGIDGEDGFCYGVDKDFKVRRPQASRPQPVPTDSERELDRGGRGGVPVRHRRGRRRYAHCEAGVRVSRCRHAARRSARRSPSPTGARWRCPEPR